MDDKTTDNQVGEGTAPSPDASLSIGAVAKASGIPVETLRTWERRYGYPNPERTDAGHRAYRSETVERLRWASRAIDAGHRASNIVGLEIDDIRNLLGGEAERHYTPVGGVKAVPAVAPGDDADFPHSWIRAVESLDGSEIDRELIVAWNALGTLRFLNERLAPFLEQIGEAWADGRLSVTHEHFASERVRDFLSGIWRPLSEHATGPIVVCTTLPGEHHQLSVQMVSCVLSLASWQVVFLGHNAPIRDIALVAKQSGASAVAVSVSMAMDRVTAAKELRRLREELPDDVSIVAGGAGTPDDVEDVATPGSLNELWTWAHSHAKLAT